MRELALAIREAASATTLEEIGASALPALARALGACPSFLAAAAASLADSEPIAGEHREVLPHYLHDFGADDPLIAVAATRPAPVLVLEDHLDQRVLHAGRAYNEFHRRYDFEHHMVVRFSGERLATPGALVMGFTRGRRQPVFGSQEVTIAQLVLPALEGAAARIRASELRPELVREAARPATAFGLTPAESRVLAVLLTGVSNRAIARHLCVSVDTVKTHVQRILRKLGVASRAQALAAIGAGRWGVPP
jgi:DNA-binding CsgD family transcriptional regulator